jgi:hypothetical protein
LPVLGSYVLEVEAVVWDELDELEEGLELEEYDFVAGLYPCPVIAI